MMTTLPFEDGTVPFKIPGSDKPGHTYYKIFGDLKSATPLVVLHGGPGGTHRMHTVLAELWPRFHIPVLLYDQIGCGESTNMDERAGDHSFWQMSLFMAELDNLLDHFRLRETGYHLLGTSFGAMWGADYACNRPRGLQKLVLGNPYGSRQLAMDGAKLRIKEMPLDVQEALKGATKADLHKEEVKKAFMLYFSNFICRNPSHPVLQQALANQKGNPAVETMGTASPLDDGQGSLKGWDVTPRLHQIIAPTLLWNGEYDVCHDICVQPLFDRIPRVRWVQFAGASHALYFEGEDIVERLYRVVGAFLTQTDATESIA